MNDWRYDGGLGLARPAKGAHSLDAAESMQLLADAEYGRVVFTLNALPAVRPVNHVVDDGLIIIRTRLSSAVSTAVRAADGVVVAYEADRIDPQARTGWSVVVTGVAYTLTDPDHIARCEQLLHPWVNHADSVIAIQPAMVTGLRIQPRTD